MQRPWEFRRAHNQHLLASEIAREVLAAILSRPDYSPPAHRVAKTAYEYGEALAKVIDENRPQRQEKDS